MAIVDFFPFDFFLKLKDMISRSVEFVFFVSLNFRNVEAEWNGEWEIEKEGAEVN